MKQCLQYKQFLFIFIFFILAMLQISSPWGTNRRFKIYSNMPKDQVLAPLNRKMQRKLVEYHNSFRTNVSPPASNMLAMTWSVEAAKDAQRWAKACKYLVHDSGPGLHVEDYGHCGQNNFVSAKKVTWLYAIRTWYLEKNYFRFNASYGINNIYYVGHYTQLVWAASHQLGCGVAFCKNGVAKPFFNYVCNYCPRGNYMKSLSRPYKKGAPCSSCKENCTKGKLCTNFCPYGNTWPNCEMMYEKNSNWLCNSNQTEQGARRLKYCKAKCLCKKNQISYPYD